MFIHCLLLIITCFLQANSSFWNKNLQDKPAKKVREKSKAPKKLAKKKADATDPFTLDDKSEVELDSLGSFFIHLIDTDCYQDDAEATHADGEEVTILSSDSVPLPRQKV